MAEAIGPGTPLICVKWYEYPDMRIDDRTHILTEGALYICEFVADTPYDDMCPWDNCGITGIGVVGKGLRGNHNWAYCPNLFRPLNDGDTSLVDAEKEKNIDLEIGLGIDVQQPKELV